ncbi:MAG: hypothetical protein PHE09_00315 [Oscillospiraceae bacterium]|nr:hypothetical protein [Oscillospiraceae bacterium]
MKNMNDKTKKWLLVAGGLALSAVLVMAIANQFKTEKPTDAPLPSQSSSASDVTVDPNAPDTTEKENDVVIQTPNTTPSASTDNGAVDTGTEQTIQDDVTKPEYTKDELTNPDQKPNGELASESDRVEDGAVVEKPQPTTPSTPSGGNAIPGFDNVPDGGANQGEYVDDMYENGNKVGTMG